MFKWIRQAIRGAGYLEGYGHHPGWSTIGIFVLAGSLAGIDKGGVDGFFGGMFITVLCIAPFFIGGCISRANGCDRDQAELLRKIKDA